MQHSILARWKGWDGKAVEQIDGLTRARFKRVYSSTPKRVGGITVNEHKFTGRLDRQAYELHGHGVVYSGRLAKADVDRYFRRLRPDEAEKLDLVDAEIADLEAKMAAARKLRRQVLEDAWQRGHVVTVKELRAACEANDH